MTKVWIHFLYRLLQLLISVQFLIQQNLIVAYQKVIEESVQPEDSSRDFQYPPNEACPTLVFFSSVYLWSQVVNSSAEMKVF